MMPTSPSATAAGILEALRFADLSALDQRLAVAETGQEMASGSAVADEEAELAAAAAGALRRSMERFRRGHSQDLASCEVPIALLRHLAARRRIR